MRAVLYGMTGSLRGAIISPRCENVRMGVSEGCEVRIPPNEAHRVHGKHAEIRRLDGEVPGFEIRALRDQVVLVNGEGVCKRTLSENDVIQLGDPGPQFRFRAVASDYDIRTFEQQVVNLGSLTAEGKGRGTTEVAQRVAADVIRKGTIKIRLAVILLVAATTVLSAILFMTWQNQADVMRHTEEVYKRSGSIIGENEQLRENILRLAREQESRAAEFQKITQRARKVSARILSMEFEATAAPRIYKQFHRGIGFIGMEVSFYHSGKSAYLRERLDPKTGYPAETGFPYTLGGKGKKMTEWLTGSGFVVSEDGLVLTNRHVVDPWWADSGFGEGLLRQGFRAVRERFFMAFPGTGELIPLIRCGAEEEVDLAVLRLGKHRQSMPALKLNGDGQTGEGEKIILLGYPEGLQGIINKLGRTESESMQMMAGRRQMEVLQKLAEIKSVVPTMTQGVLSNRRDESLVYDALTATGGSGGPLFNVKGEVIGINVAVSRSFAGANFGIPAEFAEDLVKRCQGVTSHVPDSLEYAPVDPDRTASLGATRTGSGRR